MSYKLDSTTLKSPSGFSRRQIETGVSNLTINGKVKRSVENRREEFYLEYKYLTQTEVSTILSIWNKEEIVSFEVNETNLSIGPTNVHVFIDERNYNTRGNEYREDLVLRLVEAE